MAQSEDHYYLQINEHRSAYGTSSESILPIGFFKMQKYHEGRYAVPNHDQPSRLADLRSECTRRGFMKQDDEFLFHPSSQTMRMMYQVTVEDESKISLEEYLVVSSLFVGPSVMHGD